MARSRGDRTARSNQVVRSRDAGRYQAHPLALRSVVVHVPVSARRRLPVSNAVHVIEKPIRGRVVTYRRETRPMLGGVAVGRHARPVALLRDSNSLKQRKLCKCHRERSPLQQKVSRRFFAGQGGRRDYRKHSEACAC